MNSYYVSTTDIIPYSRAKDTDIETPLGLIEAGFDKLVEPHLSKKGFGAPVPMSDATALDEGATAGQIVKSSLVFSTDTGTAGAYILTLAVAPIAYTAGLMIVFRAVNANPGAATVNVNGLGIKPLTDFAGRVLTVNYIIAGSLVMAVYDDGKFKIVSHFDQYDLTAETFALAALGSADDAADSAAAALASENAAEAYRDQAAVYQAAMPINHATFLKYQW